MSRRGFARFAFELALMIGASALLAACGPEEESQLCRSDYECVEEQVCEPEGCRTACEESSDCALGHSCELRRVEEGRVCGRVSR